MNPILGHALAAGAVFGLLNHFVLKQPAGATALWVIGAAGLAALIAWRQAR